MIVLNRNNIFEVLLLELLSYTPLIIILGNIVPPSPLKFHFYVFGLVFLIALWILAKSPSKKWVIYLAVFYLVIQPFLFHWNIKGIIDYFFGPIILLIMVDLLVNDRIPKVLLKKYLSRFYSLLWIPVIFAVLQFFSILPFTFWNATYINYTDIGGVRIPRPNGLLYHGSELSIIICFLGLFQFFKTETKAFWTIILLIFVCFATYFKAITACLIVIFLYFLFFINTGSLTQFQLISKKRIYWYGSIIAIVSISIVIQYLLTVHKYTGYYFIPEMLTGRGYIWNIYLDGINEFSIWNYLFGAGMGSSTTVFDSYANANNYYVLVDSKTLEFKYDTHNAILSIFINSGIVGLLFISSIFKMIYSQIKNWQGSQVWNKRVFWGILFIPLLTIGITIIIFEMAIIWPCIGFLFYQWYFTVNKEELNA